MTEAEWLASDDPAAMARFAARPGDRRMRLFACACCRLIWPLLTDRRSREAIDVTERHAVGLAGDPELATAADHALAARRKKEERWRALTTGPGTAQTKRDRTAAFGKDLAAHVAHTVAAVGYYDGIFGHVISANGFEAYSSGRPHPPVRAGMRDALRDILGDLFRPVLVDPLSLIHI